MIARLKPDIIVAEPSELIGTGVSCGPEYVETAMRAVKDVDPDILVLTAAGIANGQDVYNVISAGADATGSSSGVAKAADRAAMVERIQSRHGHRQLSYMKEMGMGNDRYLLLDLSDVEGMRHG